MANATEAPASGKVTEIKDGVVKFNPAGTRYELHLIAPRYDGPVGTPIRCVIRAAGRKVWTVSSGGNFIAPIFGPPRTIQGRVRSVEAQSIVVMAGCAIVVELPADDSGIDLATGPIAVNTLVNVTALPGATFEFIK